MIVPRSDDLFIKMSDTEVSGEIPIVLRKTRRLPMVSSQNAESRMAD
jgi:hypothetical protein